MANNPINAIDPLGLQAFFEYAIRDENSEEEGAALEPVGEEFASEAETLVDEFDWDALSRSAGDPGEATTNMLQIKGQAAPESISDYLPEKYFRAFKGEPQAIKLDQPLTAYRYWSNPASETGNWLTLNPNLTPEEARALLSLPNNNLAVNTTEFIIPEDTVIVIGDAASQVAEEWAGSYAIGGGFQIYVPNLSVLIMAP